MNKGSQHLVGLDGVRAISCLLVFGKHLADWFTPSGEDGIFKGIDQFFAQGNKGVSFFFVLSGFLLSLPFFQALLRGKPIPSLRRYAIKRLARVMPAYYIALGVSYLVVTYLLNRSPEGGIWRLLSGFLFLNGFHYRTLFPVEVNAALWSVSYEVWFYVGLAVAMWVAFRFRLRQTGSLFLFWVLLLGIAAFLHHQFLHLFSTTSDHRGWQYGMVGGAKLVMPNYNIAGFFLHFGLGVLASLTFAWLEISEEIRQRLSLMKIFDFLALGCLSWGIACFGCGVCRGETGLWDLTHDFPSPQLAVAVLLIALPNSTFVGRWVDNAFLRYTARISYGIYLWHCLILVLVCKFGPFPMKKWPYTNGPDWLIAVILTSVVTYLVAEVSYRFMEKPIMKWANRR